MVCPRCEISRLVEIALTLRDRPVVMRSCSDCGIEWSAGDGESLGLRGVLELAASGR